MSPALPAFAELRAPAHWRRIDFVSDLHLAESAPRTLDAFAAYLRATPADAVLILGDLFDAWIGDDARHAGFEARCCELFAVASRRIDLGFMAGNRDFLIGEGFAQACGVALLADPTVLAAFGERYLLTHGDALCLADTDYQAFRAATRDARWQREVLARPLDERRQMARQLRGQSRERQHGAPSRFVDIDAPTALAWMDAAGAATLIHGHTHAPATAPLAPSRVRHVLSDWDLDDPAAPSRAEVLRCVAGSCTRLRPEARPA